MFSVEAAAFVSMVAIASAPALCCAAIVQKRSDQHLAVALDCSHLGRKPLAVASVCAVPNFAIWCPPQVRGRVPKVSFRVPDFPSFVYPKNEKTMGYATLPNT